MPQPRLKAVLFFVLLLFVSKSSFANPASIAERLIGYGETIGDNRGPFISQIGGQQGQAWCAYFVSYCLRLKQPIPNARGFLKLRHVQTPKRGDLVIWSRGNNKRLGHVGIIKAVYNGYFETIEGNSGPFPAKVRVRKHKFTEGNIVGFVRP